MIRFNIQLFASKNQNSTSISEGHSYNEGGSSSSTTGGSSSHSETNTEGGSHTDSYTHSETNTHGNSSTISTGKNWASGAIDDKTQANFDKYNNDYAESDKVTDAYNKLQEVLTNKPTFESTYEDKLNAMYDQIMNREGFSYDFNKDAMYQLYKDQYMAAGKQAMQDTLGKAQAMNGGYGSSYSQSAGQQTYQQYLQNLNNIIPELRNQARAEYDQEGQDLMNKYNITNQAYDREYGQYRDSVADWQADRSFDYGMYSDERYFDYNKYQNDRNYWNQEYWNEKNAEQSNYQATNTWYEEQSVTDSETHSDTSYWEHSTTDTESSFWENTSGSNWASGYTSNYATTLANAQAASGYTGSRQSANTTAAAESAKRYQEWTADQKALTNDEIKARYGANEDGSIGLDTTNSYAKKISDDSPLKNAASRSQIMYQLQSIQDNQVEKFIADMFDSGTIDKNDLKYLMEWVTKNRGTRKLS